MDFHEDSIYFSDEESSCELYWSESDEENDDIRPKCIGCHCQLKVCESLMPLTGSVLWGSMEWDVKDYIDLNLRLLSIGVKLYYQCARCLRCGDCMSVHSSEEV